MNVFLGVVCIAFCVFLGYFFSYKYTDRKNFYVNFYNFNQKLKSEVNFTKRTLISMVKELEGKQDGFSKVIYAKIIDEKEVIIKENYLTIDEKNSLYNYLDGLGNSDFYTQLKILESIDGELKDKKEKSIIDEKRYKILYIKLGFLCGLAILILLL